MGWRPFNKRNYPMPDSPWDGKTFVVLRYKARYTHDSHRMEATTAMYGWNVLNGGGDRKERPTHWLQLPPG